MDEQQWPQHPPEDEWIAVVARRAHTEIARLYEHALVAVYERQSFAQAQARQRRPRHRRD